MATFKDDLRKAKELRTKVLKEVEYINNMKYEKARRKRIEAIRDQLKKIDIICGAIDRKTGKICTEKPYYREDGTTNGRCEKHGGLSTGAITEEGKRKALEKLNPRARLIHGLYSRFVMTEEEFEFYSWFMNYYTEKLDLDPANMLLLDRALRNFILNQRKEVAEAYEIIDESNSYNDYDSKFLRYMQALALDRRFKESKDNKDNPSMVDLAVLLSQAPPPPERKQLESSREAKASGEVKTSDEAKASNEVETEQDQDNSEASREQETSE